MWGIQVRYTSGEYRFCLHLLGILVWFTTGAHRVGFLSGEYTIGFLMAFRLRNASLILVLRIQVWFTPRKYRFRLSLENTGLVYAWGIRVWFTSKEFRSGLHLGNKDLVYVLRI